MKSTIFYVGSNSTTISQKPSSVQNYPFTWEITIPLLPAYALEYFSMQIGALSAYQDKNDKISGNKLIIPSEYSYTQNEMPISIILYYHGIRDYKLLFPWINDIALADRLGQFYKEAESSFDSGNWLSFSLMCGAIFEGILFAKNIPGPKKLYDLTNNAQRLGLIDFHTHEIIHKVRSFRNLVHSNNFSTPYISRPDAMDIRSVLDKIIKDF